MKVVNQSLTPKIKSELHQSSQILKLERRETKMGNQFANVRNTPN